MGDDITVLDAIKKKPATFADLCIRLKPMEDRQIDRALQKLRRQGFIAFKRGGRAPVWHVVE